MATVKAVYDAFARGDVEQALAHVSPQVELRPEGTSHATGRSVYRGRQGVREYFEDAARVWQGTLRLEPLDYRAVAGSVVVFGRVRARRDGRPFETEVVWVWKVRDGLLVSGQVFSTRGAAIAAARSAG
ncbi:MAG: nuclear transport factor 2 family protein [Solirubrobacteraceae bacterium]|nr:nuclear transport factor 2 family protein [Solirubrobacteraceae bacterium]